MLSAKIINAPVVQHHQDEPHIRTEIVILSPIGQHDPFSDELKRRDELVQLILSAINQNVEDVITEQFNANIESIVSEIKHL